MATAVNTIYPQKINEVTSNTAAGVNVGPAIAITNKASGGAIGTAAATVNIGAIFNVNQTTASQTLTIPSPTITTEYKLIVVNNVGSQSFTMLSQTVAAGTGIVAMWNGSAWSFLGGNPATFSGAVSSTSVASSGAVTSSSASAGVGYSTGAGGAVVQGTNKTTAVTSNTVTGQITMSGTGAINTLAAVGFTVNCTAIAANDVVIVNHISGGTAGAYICQASNISADTSFRINVFNTTGGNLTETPVLQYAIIKGVAA